MRAVSLLGAVLLLGAAPARPPLLPVRDVAVTYSVGYAGGGPGQNFTETVRVAFSAAGDRLRVDGQPGTLILDPGRHRTLYLLPVGHVYMELPYDPARARDFLLSGKVSFAARGMAQQAGLPCSLWDVRTERGGATVCATADGVPLRASGGRATAVATAVEYAPQPASLFEVPPGSTRMERPPGLNPLDLLRPAR